MNKFYVDNKTLSKFNRISSACNGESTIYTDGETIYKVLLPLYRDKVREKNVELLSRFEHPNCVFPREKIVNKKTEKFMGVTEEYLKAYTTLSDVLVNGNLDFETRKALAFKLCEIQQDLDNMNISFIDMHPHNVMINIENNLKLIDLDGCDVLYRKHSDVFDYIRKEIISRNLAKICFLLLYGNDFNIKNIDAKSERELLDNSTKRQKEFLESIFFRKDFVNPIEYLDDFSEEDMEVSKLILQR